jgi:hypothetical protein
LLRFDAKPQRRFRLPISAQSRGVWMLLAMLGAVLILMRQLQQPETVAQLDRILNGQRAAKADQSREAGAVTLADEGAAESESNFPRALPGNASAWAKVQDNAMFLEAEDEAWFLLWEEARELSPAVMNRQSLGLASYAQLVGQPDVYRGQAVTIKGRVLQESVKPAPKNSLGITDYHQLIVAPIGGGDYPVTVYSLDLPPGFPRGGNLEVDVSIAGLFFKNWSYPYDGGMGVSPVIVAKTFDWAPPARRAVIRPPRNRAPVAIGGVAAIACALAFVVWVGRQTRRPAMADSERPDFRHLEAEL